MIVWNLLEVQSFVAFVAGTEELAKHAPVIWNRCRIEISTALWFHGYLQVISEVLMRCSYRASPKGALRSKDSIQTCRVLQSCRAEEFLTRTTLRNTVTSCSTTALTVLTGSSIWFGFLMSHNSSHRNATVPFVLQTFQT